MFVIFWCLEKKRPIEKFRIDVGSKFGRQGYLETGGTSNDLIAGNGRTWVLKSGY